MSKQKIDRRQKQNNVQCSSEPLIIEIDSDSDSSSSSFGEFKCNQCDAILCKKSLLSSHKRLAHGPDGISTNHAYFCAVCLQDFTSKQAKDLHENTAHQKLKIIPCNSCGSLRISSGDEVYDCMQCGQSSEEKVELKPQIESIRKTKFLPNKKLVTKIKEEPVTITPAIIKSQLKRNIIYGKIGQIPLKHSGRGRRRGNGAWSRKHCETCGKTFRTPTALALHRPSHSVEATFECHSCDKKFVHYENFKMHLRFHPKQRPHTCPLCGKSFSQITTLRNHRRVHTGEKPYQCSICFKCFMVRDYLNKHMRTHTGEKPYFCIYCQKRFTQRSALVMHQVNLHGLMR